MQPLAVGVTVMTEVATASVVLVPVKVFISPVPLAATPVLTVFGVVTDVQLNVSAGAGQPVKAGTFTG